ncbi:MAG: IS4 family transposase [Chloroflexota bacterium]|nr:IS4 family transposase [Chloroflexota bacterium]
METHHEHALFQVLNAFLRALPEKYTRERKDGVWTPELTAIALLIMSLEAGGVGYSSILSMLSMGRTDLVKRKPHESSFCRARQKLTQAMLDAAWKAMRACCADMFADLHPCVHGYRLVGIDGVWINARRSKALFRATRKRKRGRPPMICKGQPQILVVALVDVLTHTPISWEYVQPGKGERSVAEKLMKHLDHRTILLADRGFPSRKILDSLDERGAKFIMRVSDGKTALNEVRAFRETGGKDRKVLMQIGQGRKARFINARLIKGHPQPKHAGKNDDWVLLTNIRRCKRWKKHIILDLYHERWGIEVFFRELKTILSADHFHSETLDGVLQELTFSMLAATMISCAEIIARTVESESRPRWNDTRQKKANRTTLRTIVLMALIKDPRTCDIAELLDQELEIAWRRAQKRRPGRSAPRICRSFYGKWKSGFKRAKGRAA